MLSKCLEGMFEGNQQSPPDDSDWQTMVTILDLDQSFLNDSQLPICSLKQWGNRTPRSNLLLATPSCGTAETIVFTDYKRKTTSYMNPYGVQQATAMRRGVWTDMYESVHASDFLKHTGTPALAKSLPATLLNIKLCRMASSGWKVSTCCLPADQHKSPPSAIVKTCSIR